MGKLIDLTGQRFGRLTVLRREGTYRNYSSDKTLPTWRCRCDCGRETVVNGNNLRCGVTQSCGCLRREALSSAMRAWHAGRREARSWKG